MEKLKVAIYARLSKEEYEDKESESIENQISAIKEYILKHSNYEIYCIYSDDGYTGLNFNRPDFQRMRQDIIDNKIDVIVCTKQSRIGRDSFGVERFLFGFLIDAQVQCIGILDGLDNFNRSNKKSAQINNLTNEWYSEEISYSIKSAFDTKRKRGEFIGAYAPYGYKKHSENKNKLIIDEDAALVVKDIFRLFLDGYGYVKIASILNERGIPTPSQSKNLNIKGQLKDYSWSYHTIRWILSSEVYIGNLIQKKSKSINFKSRKRVSTDLSEIIKVENTHEPIIDYNTFKNVQNVIMEKTKSRYSEGKKHTFSGIVICGDCGRKMGYRRDSNSFICLSFRYYGSEKCSKHYIKYSQLDELVLKDIRQMIDKYIELNKTFELYNVHKNTKHKKKYIMAEVNKIERRLDDIIHIKMKGFEDNMSDMLTDEEFKTLMDSYKPEEVTLRSKLVELNDELYRMANLIDEHKQVTNFFKRYLDLKQINYETVDEFVESIKVFESSKNEMFVHVNYSYKVEQLSKKITGGYFDSLLSINNLCKSLER